MTGGIMDFQTPNSSFSSAKFSLGTHDDAFLAKYDAQSDLLWVKHFGSNGYGNNDQINAIALDRKTDHIYVAGAFQGYLTAGNQTHAAKQGHFLLRSNGQGDVVWSKHIPSSSGMIHGLALDPSNHLWLWGTLSGTWQFDQIKIVHNNKQK
ncbi:MAG: hypothetical protein AAGJ35_16420, partial [Myxococcota bacterium]